MLKLLLSGEPFMVAILCTSFLSLGIFFYKAFFLWGKGGTKKNLLPQVMGYLEQRDIATALRIVGGDSSPTSRVLKAALQRANRSEKEIRRAVEGVALEEIPRIKGGTVYLPQLSNLATLLGLIGTINGLIVSFGGASATSAATRQAVLSEGISLAFNNTFFGLCVATASVILYLVLLTKTNATMALLEKSASSVVDNILWFRDQGRNP